MSDDASNVSLLDALVFLAENWIVLLVVPLLVGAGVFWWTMRVPPTFVATTSIYLPALDRESEDWALEIPGFQQALFHPRPGVSVEIAEDDAIITALGSSMTDATERATEAQASAIGAVVRQYEQRLVPLDAAIARIAPIVARIDETPDDLSTAISRAQLLGALNDAQIRQMEIHETIERLTAQPIVSIARVENSPYAKATAAWVTAFFSMLLVLACLSSIRRIAATEPGRSKIARIRNAFLLRH